MNLRVRLQLCLAAVSLLLTTGCNVIPAAKPDPTRFFVLEDGASTAASSSAPAGVAIGLLPIEVPAYLLDSRAIAVMTANHEITYRTFDRWAEPLDEGVTRVLRGALVQSDKINRVVMPPFPLNLTRDYELSISVLECTGVKNGPIRFSIAYTLTRPSGELQQQGKFIAPATSWTGDSGDLVAQLSAAVAAAAEAIAAELP
ncbi:PqiC family protein [Synoicihabitans lomoniglobus]|uniref:ABC-type transport auxiliary lipoprotein family protein n=1 Tax=Synoicihabitans lomoniglobus TaxID=2909285 RepID=A0AAF0A1R9_9BACT|nr:PqiC family protein [Opitutaceae bacterium LMO-M01]WED65287.1 ABC-type transport auxiliary lipoprotein family protein [Opitutaceae bacterium LMO-M01]